MKLGSNIQGVIDRLKRRPRDIRGAMARTLTPAAIVQSKSGGAAEHMAMTRLTWGENYKNNKNSSDWKAELITPLHCTS